VIRRPLAPLPTGRARMAGSCMRGARLRGAGEGPRARTRRTRPSVARGTAAAGMRASGPAAGSWTALARAGGRSASGAASSLLRAVARRVAPLHTVLRQSLRVRGTSRPEQWLMRRRSLDMRRQEVHCKRKRGRGCEWGRLRRPAWCRCRILSLPSRPLGRTWQGARAGQGARARAGQGPGSQPRARARAQQARPRPARRPPQRQPQARQGRQLMA
jgi:hypothetical protein